jgi:flagellar biogenesis protein FliO
VKLTLKPFPKWLLVPPAVALLLILGPLSMRGADAAPDGPAAPVTTQTAAPETAPEGRSSRATPPAAPRTPDLWQMSSALIGVLLLGAGGIFVLRRLRGGAAPTGTSTLATLRQTIRLGQKQALHAIEFDDRILLVGETERGLTLLDRGRLPNAIADEAEVLGRTAAATADDDDDGAVPRNLVIPRPANTPARTLAKAGATRATQQRLNDFRNLLQKAARS